MYRPKDVPEALPFRPGVGQQTLDLGVTCPFGEMLTVEVVDDVGMHTCLLSGISHLDSRCGDSRYTTAASDADD